MRRNIVLIQAESLDGRALGCMGEPGAHTPNLDRLAERGVVFENAYCNSPQCCPSRSSMWSGRYVWQVGAWNNYRGLPHSERTFVDDLCHAGYECPVIGRTDHRSGSHSLTARMSAWVRTAPDAVFRNPGPRHHVNDKGRRQRDADWAWLDAAVRWLREQRQPDRPFFLHLGLGNTHPGGGYTTSRYWLEHIDAARVRMPPRAEESHPVMRRMLQTKGCDRRFDDEFIHTCRRHYLAMVAEVDGLVGDLLATLEAVGLLETTAVLLTADHGDMRMEHGQYLKNALYEGSARVPLILAAPELSEGHRVAQPVSLVDVYPTLLDLSGGEGRTDLAGHSLVALASGRSSARADGREHPGVAFAEYHSNFQQTGSFMLRRGPWKLIEHIGYASQLFDLEEDPDEVNDRIDSEPGVAAELAAEMRGIVDIEAADRAARQCDAAEFATWRLRFPGDAYLNAMARIASHWDAEVASRFAEWTDRQCGGGTPPEQG